MQFENCPGRQARMRKRDEIKMHYITKLHFPFFREFRDFEKIKHFFQLYEGNAHVSETLPSRFRKKESE